MKPLMVYKCKNCGKDISWKDFGYLGVGYHHSNFSVNCDGRVWMVTNNSSRVAVPLLEEDIIDRILTKYQ